ncbi:MAG TPA: enoyl-CoA hydratase/isomerase family protein [Gemmatimonadaceae bacterium]|jgi:methylglutaconyl-CoA hydratase|nr:enoyl-CoA hydratase/isomerase family protein [Gemmatimonadaceae bacterium]
MIDSGTVTATLSDGIATVRFAHPKGNSLPGALLANLADAVRTAGQDPNVRVIVLRSEGPGAFCAGASFDEFKAIADPQAGKKFFMGFATLILAMIRCPKFIVTRVQGKAVGGAVGLIAASDYVLATDKAAVRLSELAVGIGPFIVGPVIQRKIGYGAFTALAVDADWRDARWAEQHSLYASVHNDTDALDNAVDTLANRLSASNPEAMALLKANFWEGTDSWDDLLSSRATMTGTLVLSDFTKRMLAER